MKNTNISPITGFVTREGYYRQIFGTIVGYCANNELCGTDWYVPAYNVHLGEADSRLLARYATIWVRLGTPSNVKFSVYGKRISVYRIHNKTRYGWKCKYHPEIDLIYREYL